MFIISSAGPNIDLTIINIEEMNNYCKRWDKMATVVTEKKNYEKLEKLNYALIANYKKARPRAIISNKKPYLQVYTALSETYQNGLLIVEDDTMSVPIAELLCNPKWGEHGVDIILCRNGFGTMTKDEQKRADYLRISADPDFDASILEELAKIYQERTLAVMIAQLFVNDQYDTLKAYIDKKSQHYAENGFSDYIDYYELNKQLSYFVYLDVKSGKIINVSYETLLGFMKKLNTMGVIPVQGEQLEVLAKQITAK